MSVCLSACLSVCLSLCLCLSACLFLCSPRLSAFHRGFPTGGKTTQAYYEVLEAALAEMAAELEADPGLADKSDMVRLNIASRASDVIASHPAAGPALEAHADQTPLLHALRAEALADGNATE